MFSDDPKTPKFSLTMKGTLLVDVRAEPPSVVLRDLEQGKPATASVELKLREGADLAIESVAIGLVGEGDEGLFAVRPLGELVDNTARYEIEFRGASTPGNYRSALRIKTNSPHTPDLQVPVRAVIPSELRYSKFLSFQKRGEAYAARTLRITARKGKAPTIKKVEDPDGLLEIEIEPRKVDEVATLRAKLKESAVAALDEEARGARHPLIVHTDHRSESRLEVSYVIRSGAASPRKPKKARVAAPVRPVAGSK